MKKFHLHLYATVFLLFNMIFFNSANGLATPPELNIPTLGDSPTPPSMDDNVPMPTTEKQILDTALSETMSEVKLGERKLASITQDESLPSKPPRHFERLKSPNSNYISIMGQDGAVITVWALARRNWLWGYAPIHSQNFGNIRNWRLERSFARELFRFVNQQLGTCIQVYKKGLIHDTCDKRRLDQDFILLPTNTGSVFIKSAFTGECITYDPVNKNNYDTLTMQKCDEKITPFHDQNFYLAPPILAANPDISWEN